MQRNTKYCREDTDIRFKLEHPSCAKQTDAVNCGAFLLDFVKRKLRPTGMGCVLQQSKPNPQDVCIPVQQEEFRGRGVCRTSSMMCGNLRKSRTTKKGGHDMNRSMQDNEIIHQRAEVR